MSGNSFGKALVLTTFGESHGEAVGGILDGFPSNVPVPLDFIQSELDRRRPGGGAGVSTRGETDRIEILSGIFEGGSTGAPIAFLVYNHDQRSGDYDGLRDIFRPSHADFTWQQKYGIRDHRGGGRASARETLARVAGGAFAKLLLNSAGIRVVAATDQIGPFLIAREKPDPATGLIGNSADSGIDKPDREFSSFEKTRSTQRDPETGIHTPVRYSLTDPVVQSYLDQLIAEGDSTGAVVGCSVTGVPAGLGEPVFDKLQADLAQAVMSINAARGFEYGSGFDAVSMRGSDHNDPFTFKEGRIRTTTNRSGGIQGGISNGEEIFFRVAFKPIPSLKIPQQTVDKEGRSVILKGSGRHDVCVVPRVLPVVEAMTALVIADHLIRYEAAKALKGV